MVVNYNNCMISAKCTSRGDLGLVIEEEIGKRQDGKVIGSGICMYCNRT